MTNQTDFAPQNWILLLCVCVCSGVHVSVLHVQWLQRSEKGVGATRTGVVTFVGHHVGVESEPASSERATNAFNHWATSGPSPLCFCRPETDVRCLRGLSLRWHSPTWLHWLGSELQRSSRLCPHPQHPNCNSPTLLSLPRYVSAGNLNSAPQVYTANILPTKSLPHPLLLPFDKEPLLGWTLVKFLNLLLLPSLCVLPCKIRF